MEVLVWVLSVSKGLNQLFQNILLGALSGGQTFWIQIRTDVMSLLIWVQTFCKVYLPVKKNPPHLINLTAPSSCVSQDTGVCHNLFEMLRKGNTHPKGPISPFLSQNKCTIPKEIKSLRNVTESASLFITSPVFLS